MTTRLLTRVFWQHAGETTVGYSASTVGGVLLLHVGDLITNVPWYAVLSAAAIGGLIGLSKSLTSLIVQPDNGTASFLRSVVAAPLAGHGWDPIDTNPANG